MPTTPPLEAPMLNQPGSNCPAVTAIEIRVPHDRLVDSATQGKDFCMHLVLHIPENPAAPAPATPTAAQQPAMCSKATACSWLGTFIGLAFVGLGGGLVWAGTVA